MCFRVAEHHDGFQMYRSDLSDWNAVETWLTQTGDVLGELKRGSKKAGNSFLYIFPDCVKHRFFLGNGKTVDWE